MSGLEAGEVPAWATDWFPLHFVEDLPVDRPVAVSVHDVPLVLHRAPDGRWACALDRCPHRSARLSDGSLRDGRLECLYHGWRFDASGACTRIPQLPDDQTAPSGACLRTYPVEVRQGMVWAWLGEEADADPEAIPTIAGLDEPDVVSIDFVMDLPYDQSYLVENVIDVAHIHIAHHDMRGGGHRAHAKPLAFELVSSGPEGLEATFRTLGLEAAGAPTLEAARVGLKGPHLVWYRSDYVDASRRSGLALYGLPLGAGRCRLLYRSYANFYSDEERNESRWRRHLTLCEILEQDMDVVVGQAAWIDGSERPLGEQWQPLKTSDSLVLAYRRWLDEHGSHLPRHRGLTTSTVPAADPGEAARVRVGLDPRQRWLQHTRHCADCTRAYDDAGRRGRLCRRAVVPLLAAAAVLAPGVLTWLLAAAALAAGAGAMVAQRTREQLERPAVGEVSRG